MSFSNCMFLELQTKELRGYLKELGAEISEENTGDAAKDLIQVIDASEICWKEVSGDSGTHIYRGYLGVFFR